MLAYFMFLHKTTKRQLCGIKFVIHRDGPGVDHTKNHLTLCVIVGCFRHFPTQIAMTLYRKNNSINTCNTSSKKNSVKTKRSSNSANLLGLNVFSFNHRNKSTTVTFFCKNPWPSPQLRSWDFEVHAPAPQSWYLWEATKLVADFWCKKQKQGLM